MSFLKGKRTIIFNILCLAAAIFGAAEIEINEWLQHNAPELIGVFALTNLVLRKITTTPVGVSDPNALKRTGWNRAPLAFLCAGLGLTLSGCATTYTSAMSEDNSRLTNFSVSLGGSKINGKQQGASYSGGPDGSWTMTTTDASDEMSSEAAAMEALISGVVRGAIKGASPVP